MSIHRRNRKSGIRYLALVYTPGGRQITKTFRRKVDAERWETEQKHQLYASPLKNKETMLVKSNTKLALFCDEWLRDYAVHSKTASSVRRDRQIIKNQISPHLGSFRLNELTQKTIEHWKFELKDQLKLSPKTCNNCLALLSKILGDACRWRYLEVNEAWYVRNYKIQKKEPRFFTRDQAKNFMAYALDNYPDYYTVFALALYAGLRKGEIRGLQWDAVDLSRRVIVVKRIFCDTEKRIIERTKGKNDRTLPINDALFQVLMREKELNSQPLVAHRFDWSHPHRLMANLCKDAKLIPIRFHDLRHSFASILVMQGKPLYEVQKLLGHASISTTEQYSHLAPDYLKGATDGLDFERNIDQEDDDQVIPLFPQG